MKLCDKYKYSVEIWSLKSWNCRKLFSFNETQTVCDCFTSTWGHTPARCDLTGARHSAGPHRSWPPEGWAEESPAPPAAHAAPQKYSPDTPGSPRRSWWKPGPHKHWPAGTGSSVPPGSAPPAHWRPSRHDSPRRIPHRRAGRDRRRACCWNHPRIWARLRDASPSPPASCVWGPLQSEPVEHFLLKTQQTVRNCKQTSLYSHWFSPLGCQYRCVFPTHNILDGSHNDCKTVTWEMGVEMHFCWVCPQSKMI